MKRRSTELLESIGNLQLSREDFFKLVFKGGVLLGAGLVLGSNFDNAEAAQNNTVTYDNKKKVVITQAPIHSKALLQTWWNGKNTRCLPTSFALLGHFKYGTSRDDLNPGTVMQAHENRFPTGIWMDEGLSNPTSPSDLMTTMNRDFSVPMVARNLVKNSWDLAYLVENTGVTAPLLWNRHCNVILSTVHGMTSKGNKNSEDLRGFIGFDSSTPNTGAQFITTTVINDALAKNGEPKDSWVWQVE